jgi:sortase (surface protein transpeptidase)
VAAGSKTPGAKTPSAVRPVAQATPLFAPPAEITTVREPPRPAVSQAAILDPVAAITGVPSTSEQLLEVRREARQHRPPSRRDGVLYDSRFLGALFVLAAGIVGLGLWELLSQPGVPLPGPGGGAILPGNGVQLPGGPVIPVLVIAGAAYLLLVRVRRAPAATPDKEAKPGKGWHWLYDTRVMASIVAVVLAGYGFAQLAPPGATPDIREIPGEVSNAIQAAAAQPESGFPRIKINSVSIDLLLVKGDGKTPPVKYEAFTYPGADHLLTGDENGGSNTYVYAHARNGMFWRLHDLHIGNIIDIDYGGGRFLHYRVSEIHPSVNWRDLNWLQPTTDDRVTLQTCNGWKDDDPRFVVVARRVPDKTALAG